jgi:hypothetical protein
MSDAKLIFTSPLWGEVVERSKIARRVRGYRAIEGLVPLTRISLRSIRPLPPGER